MAKGTPPRDALPPPPQRITPACKGARCGAAAGFRSRHQPHPGQTDGGTPAARPRGRAVGGGTAPDIRRTSQRWQATPPRGRPPTTPAARSPHRAWKPRGQCWVPTPARPRPRHEVDGPEGGQSGEGKRLTSDASQKWRKSAPPGDTPPPAPQRATLARKGARCGAGAGSPRPHQPHPGHTGLRTPAPRPRGRAVGGGTAPDTRGPSQLWLATPPGDGPPPPPRHAAPTGHASHGDSVGPPHPHTRANSTWVADPDSPLGGRAVG